MCASISVCVCVGLQAECRRKQKCGSRRGPQYRHASDYHTLPPAVRPAGRRCGQMDAVASVRSHTSQDEHVSREGTRKRGEARADFRNYLTSTVHRANRSETWDGTKVVELMSQAVAAA